MARIQSATLAASKPLISLWSDISKAGFSGKDAELIPVKETLQVVKESLALIGNCSSYINEVRRQSIINKVKPRKPHLASFLQDVCKELFGPTVKKRISERAQTMMNFNESIRSMDPPAKPRYITSKCRFLGDHKHLAEKAGGLLDLLYCSLLKEFVNF